MSNRKFDKYEKQNTREDLRRPPKHFRVAVVMIEIVCVIIGGGYGVRGILDGADYFTAPLKLGPEYALSVNFLNRNGQNYKVTENRRLCA